MENRNVPSICIVGRPNVGKSSLFNQLLGERRAVVVEQSGTTRDSVEALIKIDGYSFKLSDTGGYLAEDPDLLSRKVKEKIYGAVEEASLLLLVTDAQEGVSPADREVAGIIRKFDKPVILVANKADNHKIGDDVVEFYQLGFGEPIAVSCLHKIGLDDLKKRIVDSAKELVRDVRDEKRYFKIAIIGRPNVGKSSFVNRLLDKERVIVSDIPGTTRDPVDTFFSYNGDEYVLIDTAGIRHRRKIKTVVDTFSVMRSEEAIKRADVVALLIDAADGITQDDEGILDTVEDNGKACLIVVNKWDLSEEASQKVTTEEYGRELAYASPRLRIYPFAFVSAKTGKNVLKTLSIMKLLDANLDLKVTTPFLNKLMGKYDPAKVPIARNKKRPNFFYITQTCCRPMAFTIFVNDPRAVLTAHLSYIENMLRDNLPLKGIPIKIHIRKSNKEKK